LQEHVQRMFNICLKAPGSILEVKTRLELNTVRWLIRRKKRYPAGKESAKCCTTKWKQ